MLGSVDGALFFANADAVRSAIRAEVAEDTRAVVLDAETVPAIDVTAVGMLVELADDFRRNGIELVLARDIGGVRDLVLRAERHPAAYSTVRAVVDALQQEARTESPG
jgi:MFS superfamily sulfate permease-like transporter